MQYQPNGASPVRRMSPSKHRNGGVANHCGHEHAEQEFRPEARSVLAR